MKKLILIFALLASSVFAATTVTVGSKVTMTVTYTGGTPTASFGWYKDGVAIPGATANTYVIPVVAAGHAGNYTAQVYNSAGSNTSPVEAITVTQLFVAPTGSKITITVEPAK